MSDLTILKPHRTRKRELSSMTMIPSGIISEEQQQIQDVLSAPGWGHVMTQFMQRAHSLRSIIFTSANDEDKVLDAVFEMRKLRDMLERVYTVADIEIPAKLKEMFG
jgi:hypothetical protein